MIIYLLWLSWYQVQEINQIQKRFGPQTGSFVMRSYPQEQSNGYSNPDFICTRSKPTAVRYRKIARRILQALFCPGRDAKTDVGKRYQAVSIPRFGAKSRVPDRE